MLKFSFSEGLLTVFADGRIDSNNAPEIEKEIFENAAGSNCENIIFDAEKLEYISSAGLRVVLKMKKSYKDFKIINASAEVYDIFEMTGFTEILTVEKAYRKVSVDGCEVIGVGANGKVYRLDGETIIKVYINPDSLPYIHRERELARKAFVLGIPTAISYDVVKVGEGYGSVFEMLNAKSFAKLLKDEPEKMDEYVKLYVELLRKIHSTKVEKNDMPSIKEYALEWASVAATVFDKPIGDKLIKLFNEIPDRMNMIHGDYHVKNVLLQNGEVLLIDMDTLSFGHPIFELSSMFNAYVGFIEVTENMSETFLGVPYDTIKIFWNKVLRAYLDSEDEKYIKEIEDKAALIGYSRLIRRIINHRSHETPEGRRSLDIYKNHILELIDKVDTLDF